MSHRGRRILVVESNAVIRMDIADYLKGAGFTVLEADGGVQALRLLKDPDEIDLIVTAISMPAPDGILVAIRARTHGRAVPVVFVSGHGELLAEAWAPAPHRRLPKPIAMLDLHSAVDELLPFSPRT